MMEFGRINEDESGSSVWEYIKSQGARNDDGIVQEDTVTGATLTFGKISENVEKLALSLQRLDLANGVAICSENNTEYCWVLLGVLHAGARCTLLSPAYSARELRHFLQLTKPGIVLCSKFMSDKVFEDAGPFVSICMEHSFVKKLYIWGTNQKNSDYGILSSLLDAAKCSCCTASDKCLDENENKVNKVLGDEALVLASSGSTGLPKDQFNVQGVVLTHKAVVESLKLSRVYARSKETGLGLMPMFHAYGLILSLMCLCQGSKLIIVPKLTGAEYLAMIINKYQINNLYLIPSLLALIGKNPIFTRENLRWVNHVWTGAANISKSIQDEARKKMPNATLHHSYGMTETTFVTLTGICDKPSSPGKLVSNVECRVMKENNICGPDQPGELQFRGATLMKGYLNNKKATDETIVNGWLKSGDLGYYDSDGDFFIVDRIKEIIKYQGHQVSPVEVEGVILTHPDILEAAVIGLPDDHFGELPMAGVVVRENSKLTADEIMEHVAKQVSPHKRLRGGVIFLKKLPRTGTGKLQRKALLAQVQDYHCQQRTGFNNNNFQKTHEY